MTRIGQLMGRCLVGASLFLVFLSAQAHTSTTGLARMEFVGDEAHYALALVPSEIGESAQLVLRGAAGDQIAAQQVSAIVQTHLQLTVDDTPCRIKRTRLQDPQRGDDRVNILLDWQCAHPPGVLVLHDTLSQLFGEQYRSIVSISRSTESKNVMQSSPDGVSINRQEYILDRANPQARVDFGLVPPSSFGSFFQLGIEHIITGLDHLLFLAALLLGSRCLRSLLITVTAFTAAHSVSLAAATLGLAHVSGNWVEPAIAVSIMWVAIENLRKSKVSSRRYSLTFAFGLIHGLAFSEALTELHLSSWFLARALLGFNLGVEMGQALAVLLLTPALAWLARHSKGPRIERWLSVGIGGMGLVWLVQRMQLT